MCVFCAPQLSISDGDRLLVHAKPSPDWWWAELSGVIGYVPANHLRQDAAEEEVDGDASPEDPWQDEEYFGSYGTLVRNSQESWSSCCTCSHFSVKPFRHPKFHPSNASLNTDMQKCKLSILVQSPVSLVIYFKSFGDVFLECPERCQEIDA